MNAIAATLRPIPFPSMARLRSDPVTQAFTLLRIGFVVLPILMGLDKFAEVMNENWTAYLATEFNDIIPGNAQDAMYAVGAVEILAGLVSWSCPASAASWSRPGWPGSSSACCWSGATVTSPSATSGSCSAR